MSYRNESLNKLVMRISSRADDMAVERVVRAFARLDGLHSAIEVPTSQVVYGRRGSGKTHSLVALAEQVRADGDLIVYLDLRQIGSSGGLYNDPRRDVAERATQLLADILERVHEVLYHVVVGTDDGRWDSLLPLLDGIVDAVSEVQVVGEVEIDASYAAKSARKQSRDRGFDLGKQSAAWKSADSEDESNERSRRTVLRGRQRPHLLFGSLAHAWRALSAELAPRRFWLVLDEWTSLPVNLQPLLADLLRRTFVPLPNVVLKIGAVQRAARFETRYPDGDYLGLEMGADIPSTVSIDEALRTPDVLGPFLEQLVHRHLGLLFEDLGATGPWATSATELRKELFADNHAWQEFVLSSEGVPRDALHVLSGAARGSGSSQIDTRAVRIAAKDTYMRYKRGRLSGSHPALQLLRDLLDEVLGRRRSRTFALTHSADADDERIRELYEARLIHQVETGIPDIDRPGTLYDVFAIDYSCFVSSLTGKQVHVLHDVQGPVPSGVAQVDPATVMKHVYSLRGYRDGDSQS